jgi:hypothetical protein
VHAFDCTLLARRDNREINRVFVDRGRACVNFPNDRNVFAADSGFPVGANSEFISSEQAILFERAGNSLRVNRELGNCEALGGTDGLKALARG